MGDYEFRKTITKAAKDFIITAFAVGSAALGAALGEYFSKGENIEAALAVLPAPLIAVLVPLISAGAVALANWAKHRRALPNVAPVLLLLLLPAFASAQDPAPKPQSEAALSCGAMRFLERGSPDSEDFVCRLSLTVPAPSGLTLFARADYTRSQGAEPDGDLFNIATFRSIEGFAGGRKEIAPNLSATAFAGVTWNRDKVVEPTDPRLWTVAGGLRYDVPKRGHVVVAFGHHGPVDGPAVLGSVVYDLGDNAAWFADVAVPVGASRFALSPYTVRFGVSVRMREKKF